MEIRDYSHLIDEIHQSNVDSLLERVHILKELKGINKSLASISKALALLLTMEYDNCTNLLLNYGNEKETSVKLNECSLEAVNVFSFLGLQEEIDKYNPVPDV